MKQGTKTKRRIKRKEYKLRNRFKKVAGIKVQDAAAELDKHAVKSGGGLDLAVASKLANDPKNPLYTVVSHDRDAALLKVQKDELRWFASALVRVVVFTDDTTEESSLFTSIPSVVLGGEGSVIEDEADEDEVLRKLGAKRKCTYVNDLTMRNDKRLQAVAIKGALCNIEYLEERCSRIKALDDPELRRVLKRVKANLLRELRGEEDE